MARFNRKSLVFLSKEDRQLLERIMWTGGYFYRDQAARLAGLLGIGTGHSALSSRIQGWIKKGFVEPLGRLDRGSLYKLKWRALRLLNNRGSSIRAEHSLLGIERKLFTLDFALEYWSRGFTLAFTPIERWKLCEQAGFSPILLPEKWKGVKFVRDADQPLGLHSGETSPLYVFLLDRPYTLPRIQLGRMLRDLEGLILSGSSALRFEVIVPSTERAREYFDEIGRVERRSNGVELALSVNSLAPESIEYDGKSIGNSTPLISAPP